ncbi:MAG: hypothetical protein KJO41_05680 [Bacteroidia bacterium]|nr:hypothetical protein [Bacteroidia bacterium]MBT8278473.1 hypothetical protein [Bacteroidia bacterium]NND26351.1 hypothetical protein [Flavobacteriaceae bacterium]NNK59129.1 hypothetical protein [Flavobacteriaceae bacterium]NNL31709.1 hypothetical protein [Flavobacteriaceae bacterium]
MIKDNKLTKYLFYAIGEIILVVIGILIALQINNWNESRKSHAFEVEILTQVRTNLINDKFSLETISSNFENAIWSSNKILESNWTAQDQDSLKYWLGAVIQFDRFQPLTNAYEVLKSKGLDQVRNKQLRFLLGSYYDDEANKAIKAIGDIEETFKNEWVPILRIEAKDMKFKNFVIMKDTKLFTEESLERNILKINRDNFGGGKIRIDGTINTIEKILELITKELEK